MAKGAYVGINGVARKIKGGYVGVSDTAQKIKKAYVGVGGVARPCWGSEGKPEYYGVVSELTYSRKDPGGGVVGDYFVVAGGIVPGSRADCVTYVEAYSSNLTHSVLDPLTTAMCPTSSAVGDYLLMTSVSATSVMQTYSRQLVRGTAPSLSVIRAGVGGVRHATHAIFAGGVIGTGLKSWGLGYIDAYSASLVRSSLAELPNAPDMLSPLAGEVLGTGGALTYSDLSLETTTLMMHDATLVRTTRTNPFTPLRAANTAFRTANHVIFAGDARWNYDAVKHRSAEALDEKFVLHTVEALTPPTTTIAHVEHSSTGLNWGLIAMRFSNSKGDSVSCIENLYSPELVQSTMSNLQLSQLPSYFRSNEELMLGVDDNSKVLAYKIS